jgi:DNA-binding NarL/FixJ family response regulator
VRVGGAPLRPVDPPETDAEPGAETGAGPLDGAELRQPGADILRMVAEGRTNVEIAGELHLSRQAVNYHVGRLMRALGAANRTALVALAYRRGLLQLTG